MRLPLRSNVKKETKKKYSINRTNFARKPACSKQGCWEFFCSDVFHILLVLHNLDELGIDARGVAAANPHLPMFVNACMRSRIRRCII
jgi:hypothetical protein